MKILHTADWHIRDKDIQEIEKCLNFIVETAKKEKVDLVVHCGDVFDAAIRADSLSAKLAFRVFKELAEIAPTAIILGTHSHDFTTASILQYINARYSVHVSTHPEQLYLCEGEIAADSSKLSAPMEAPVEVVISMVTAPSKRYFVTDSDIQGTDAQIAQAMSVMFTGFAAQAVAYKDAAHILVGHWQTDGALISETQSLTGIDISLSKEQMALGNFDLICLGHLHEKQQISDNIFYSGSLTGLNWGETTDKGFYIHEFEGKKLVNSRFMKTPSRKLIKISEDLTGAGTLADETGIPIMDMLIAAKPFKEVKDAIVRIEFKVYQDEAAKINKEELEQSIISSGAKAVDIRIIRIPRENVRSQNILKLTSLRDKLVEMANLNNKTIPDTILAKADMLESEEADKIIARIGI